MDKLSSILPSSSRVTSVDLDESPPARPGSPSFGRKIGVNSVRDRISLSPQAKEMAAKETLLGKNPKEVSRSKAVAEISRKFFETRLKPNETRASIAEQASGEALEKISERMPLPRLELEELPDDPVKDLVNEPTREPTVSPYDIQTQNPSRISIEA